MPEWLGMTIDQRFDHFNRLMIPILKKYEQQVRFKFYDNRVLLRARHRHLGLGSKIPPRL